MANIFPDTKNPTMNLKQESFNIENPTMNLKQKSFNIENPTMNLKQENFNIEKNHESETEEQNKFVYLAIM